MATLQLQLLQFINIPSKITVATVATVATIATVTL